MIVIGIDPGYGRVGYGIISYNQNKYKVIEYGCITTKEKSYFPKRLNKIEEDLEQIIKKYPFIDAASVEELYFNTNTTTAINVAQARGVIINTLARNGIEVFEYTPLQAKQAVVGYGRAEKTQVKEMTKKLLKLENMPALDDTTDALAIAICHTNFSKFNSISNNNSDGSSETNLVKQIKLLEKEGKKAAKNLEIRIKESTKKINY